MGIDLTKDAIERSFAEESVSSEDYTLKIFDEMGDQTCRADATRILEASGHNGNPELVNHVAFALREERRKKLYLQQHWQTQFTALRRELYLLKKQIETKPTHGHA